MNDALTQYDHWLAGKNAPAALVIREHLVPVEGPDGVLFPPTFAAAENGPFKGGYNIDDFANGGNVCLVDSVGSQANRVEPLFAKKEYAGLVPQIVIKAGEQRINLLDAGHRAGDAIVRCSELQQELQDAFKAVRRGDAEPLAKLAPTSLVFGVWDSRDTQAKLPRLISSTIRAYDVRALTRSAQFVPATEFVERGLIADATDKATKQAQAERGFVHVPASGSHGGVIATGGVRRDASLHLEALRLLAAAGGEQATLKLRRYILGLALTGFTSSPLGYLRQGCNLVLDPDKPRSFVEVHHDGRREQIELTHARAIEYAQVAADAFGIGADREVAFDKERAQKDLSGETGKAGKKKSESKK